MIDPQRARSFAVEVVRTLRDAGFEALWAGGCVRDQLLGREPKDYDVATSATPDEIRRVFGRRRTLSIGAAFGVITVLGRKPEGQIEVATFRQDAKYSDGRHPDSVRFSNAQEDAQRRDFTVNGLFFDPVESRVIDYVGGREDLERRLIRAIGDPFARIEEDKLRMLRAVRFAATFEFDLDPQTRQAVKQQAGQISVVSAERITAEMRRMLVHPTRARAVRLLREADLLNEILPEVSRRPEENWRETLLVLEQAGSLVFPAAFAELLRDEVEPRESEQICRRWRMSNDETRLVGFLLENLSVVLNAQTTPWPRLQRVLTAADIKHLLAFAAAVAKVVAGGTSQVDFCREKLALPREQLDPPPLITGDDLIQSGIKPGRKFRQLLDEVRDAQLDGRIHSRDEAIELARSLVGD